MAAEDVGFPLVAQAARLLRQTTGRQDEEVTLVTSAGPEKLDAAQWLAVNRASWGIENGLHQRLDSSQNEDRGRIRHPAGLWIMGLLRRLSNSLFMEWRGEQGKAHPEFLTPTDFQSAMSEEHRRRALRLVLSKKPNFNPS